MSNHESDPQAEVLKSIATTLKGIQNSLEQLTGAVEGVAESIEKAHEPEGDLGVHLVGALKDLTSALHKRAQQERSQQPQQGQQRQNQQQGHRDRHPRHEDRDRQPLQDQQKEDHRSYREPYTTSDDPSSDEQSAVSDRVEETEKAPENKASQAHAKSPRPNTRERRRGNGRSSKPSADQ